MRQLPKLTVVGTLVLSVALVAPLESSAQATDVAAEPADPPAVDSGWFPALLAVAPGTLVHGAGHFAAGDRDTALTLLGLEGLSLGLIGAGGVPIVFSGASRRIVGPSAALVVSGIGLFVLSGAADVYGAATGGTCAHGSTHVSTMVARAGYQYVEDPLFRYHSFLLASVDLWMGDLRLRPSIEQAADDPNRHLRGELAWRLVGPSTGRASVGSSSLDAAVAATWRDYGQEGFNVSSGEVRVDGRLDLSRISRTLRGSFADAELGWGLEAYTYNAIPGSSFGEDVNEMLLARFGWGVWIGASGPGHGELVVYYDHRRDTVAGGFPTPGIPAGFLGFFGLGSTWMLTRSWGLSAEGQLGSANVARLTLIHHYGGGTHDR